MIHRVLLIAVAAMVALSSLSTDVTAFGVSRGAESRSRVNNGKTVLYAAAKKAATKKSSAKKSSKTASKNSSEEEVVNFKKAEFVSAVAEKTGMTKADSEVALAAVLNVIANVSN